MDVDSFAWWQEFMDNQERTTWSQTGGTFPSLLVPRVRNVASSGLLLRSTLSRMRIFIQSPRDYPCAFAFLTRPPYSARLRATAVLQLAGP